MDILYVIQKYCTSVYMHVNMKPTYMNVRRAMRDKLWTVAFTSEEEM